MATMFGTSHFVSHAHAVSYYRPYAPDLNYRERRAWIDSKVREGEIHIGRPECQPGESIVLIDNGTRYAIEAPDIGDKARRASPPHPRSSEIRWRAVFSFSLTCHAARRYKEGTANIMSMSRYAQNRIDSILLIVADDSRAVTWTQVHDLESLTERLGEHAAIEIWEGVERLGRYADSDRAGLMVAVPAPLAMPPAPPVSRATWHNRPAPSSNARVTFRHAYRNLRRVRQDGSTAALVDWPALDHTTAIAVVCATCKRAEHVFSVAASRTVQPPYTFESAVHANLESARYRKRNGYGRGEWRTRIALHPGGINGSAALCYPYRSPTFQRPRVAGVAISATTTKGGNATRHNT